MVVVAPSSGILELPFVPFYYVAADGSGYQPVVNFSELPDQEAYFAQPDDGGLPMRLIRRGPGHSRRKATCC